MRPALWLAGLLLTVPAGALAAAHERVRIDYMLPATTVTAGVQQRITKCPAAADVQAATTESGEAL